MKRELNVGAVAAAVLLPPLGIFIVRRLSNKFWIGAGLTLLGWLPGVVFALVTIACALKPTRA
jgi:uncharacterized membrane protein YqaE (UPF0057 family)